MSKPTVLVTGSAGHLGKALMLALPDLGYSPIGIDLNAGPTTTHTGSITDTAFLTTIFTTHQPAHVIHAATLHKPHIDSHTKNDFIQTNIAGTLALLEAATTTPAAGVGAGAGAGAGAGSTVKSFIFISTTSTFGAALSPSRGSPAAWITESVTPLPKNIYGATKTAAEDICQLIHRQTNLPILILRTSRFFPEEDDDGARREAVAGGGDNLKVLELAYRRVDIADVVGACVCAMRKGAAAAAGEAGGVGWGKYIVSAPTPFGRDEETLRGLDGDAEGVFRRVVPGVAEVFERKGWSFLGRVDRVYDSGRAVRELGWRPKYTFEKAVERVARGGWWGSELALKVGRLGYHAVSTGVYTTREEKGVSSSS
ncbi:NAD dependent epimerase/dehydratase family protein [Chaetomium fimeti]|uniref:NAD dependent epimerase/dehydratase family protein n=1 Tax=Chaetomium fimeti TaxID=1854472 RepID=A0AAE0HLN3_9PEZI|nr:NAD dependent epimerase/dehydratase family protein [Chaetomium fimeti]